MGYLEDEAQRFEDKVPDKSELLSHAQRTTLGIMGALVGRSLPDTLQYAARRIFEATTEEADLDDVETRRQLYEALLEVDEFIDSGV